MTNKPKLPKNIEIDLDEFGQYFDLNETDFPDRIADYLSDKYGYCINGYSYSIKVNDIDWDTKED